MWNQRPFPGCCSHWRCALPWSLVSCSPGFPPAPWLLRSHLSERLPPPGPLVVALCPHGTLSWLFSPTLGAPITSPMISGPSSQFTCTYKASSCGLCISKSKPGPLPKPAPLSVLYPTTSLFASPSLGVSSSVARPAPPTFILTASPATSATPLRTLQLGKLSPLDAFPWPCPSPALCTKSPGPAHLTPMLGVPSQTHWCVSLLCSRCSGLAITRAASSALFLSLPPSPVPLRLPNSCSPSVTPQQPHPCVRVPPAPRAWLSWRGSGSW